MHTRSLSYASLIAAFVSAAFALVVPRARGDAQLPTTSAASARRRADAALAAGPWSVTQKRRTPSSGDKHDYMSMGPYWWPDPTRPGGLPYIRRDGQVNPEVRDDSDSDRMSRMADAVTALAHAYALGGASAGADDRARYGARAALLLHSWFLDAPTRMNPNLRFGQAVPGRTEGRGTGIIDSRVLIPVLDAVGQLRGAPGWTDADARAMREWVRAYRVWMATSPQGIEERDTKNNHAFWYDAQDAAFARFVGDSAGVRAAAERTRGRLAEQIAPDGALPEELARTRPQHYTFFALDPLAQVAEMGRAAGVDVWGWRAPNGASVSRAFTFAARYVDTARTPAPGDALVRDEPGLVRAVFARAIAGSPDATLRATLRAALAALPREDDSAAAPHSARRATSALDTLAPRALAYAAAHLAPSADTLDPAGGWPRSTHPDGTWDRRGATAWTSGFFPGTLWYLYDATRDPVWRARATRWTVGLEGDKDLTTTHDLGFLLFDSFGQQLRLTGDAHARAVLLHAAGTLARRYNPTVGAIKSWDTERQTDRRGAWRYPVIVDNLMNLELLFWAGAQPDGDTAWRRTAERHAMTSLAAHLRDDGSTVHVALFDPATGARTGRVTWQGAADTSAWARGQAWAIYGFGAAYRETRRPALLAGARRAADWLLAHLPPDGVPYWDFRHPAIPNVPRDASAAAIAASGLLALADLTAASDSAAVDAPRYRAGAERILTTLATDYLSTGTNSATVLRHSVGNAPEGDEVDVGIVYADYYFVEALLRWQRGAGR